jgi:hypothetical protein
VVYISKSAFDLIGHFLQFVLWFNFNSSACFSFFFILKGKFFIIIINLKLVFFFFFWKNNSALIWLVLLFVFLFFGSLKTLLVLINQSALVFLFPIWVLKVLYYNSNLQHASFLFLHFEIVLLLVIIIQ